MEEFFMIFYYYLIVVNILAFLLMGVDKSKAKHHRWRIPEKTLFLSAIIGGSAGAILGMYTFHHKTKHWYFVAGHAADSRDSNIPWMLVFLKINDLRPQFSLEKCRCIYYYHYKYTRFIRGTNNGYQLRTL